MEAHIENERETLRQLNREIRDAEWSRNIHFMQEVLDDDLMFQRASGAFADKSSYLKDLEDIDNTYNYLDQKIDSINVDDRFNKAVVITTVAASGTRGEKQLSFSGIYKNIRLFRKNPNWQVYAWYNEVIGQPFMIMRIPGGEIKYKENKSNNMCGRVSMESSNSAPRSPYTRALYVKFEDGAYTKWHYHSGVQILRVEEGVGFVEQIGFPSFYIQPGDRIYIPENTWHRHGAKQGETMTHMAITNGDTIWQN